MINKDISKNLFIKLLLSLVAIRVVMVVLLMVGVPDVGFFNHGYFPTNSGGDEHTYFKLAKNFSEFNLEDTSVVPTIGAPLFFVPFIWLTGAEVITDIIPLVFVFQTFILYGLSIFLVSYIASKLLRNRLLGFVLGAFYVFYPYLILLANVGPYSNNYDTFIDAMWLRAVYSDAPSAFFIFSGVALFLYSLERKKGLASSAIFFGLATLVRITNVFIGPSLSLIYLFKKQYKKFLMFNLIFVAVFSVQLVFNQVVNGNVLQFSNYNKETVEIMEHRFETKTADGKISELGFSFGNYLYFLTVLDKYIPYLPFVLVVLVSLFIFNFYNFLKINSQGAIFIFLWTFAFSLFFFGYAPAARNIRHWLPVLPAFIILGINFLIMINDGIRKKYE